MNNITDIENIELGVVEPVKKQKKQKPKTRICTVISYNKQTSTYIVEFADNHAVIIDATSAFEIPSDCKYVRIMVLTAYYNVASAADDVSKSKLYAEFIRYIVNISSASTCNC